MIPLLRSPVIAWITLGLLAAPLVGQAPPRRQSTPRVVATPPASAQPAANRRVPAAAISTPPSSPAAPATAAQVPAAPAPAVAVVGAEGQAPFVLQPKEAQRLNEILRYWEQRSQQIKNYQCQFDRWEYDPIFGPKEPNTPKTHSTGSIKYAAPDRGMFRVDKIGHFKPAKDPNGKPTWPLESVEHLEHWICDGRSVFEYNAQQKQLVEHPLPPEMQGKAISEGPLPFLFGATAKQLHERYWLREVPPPKDAKGVYWLEARPKRRKEAADFSKAFVILDQEMFLPTALRIYLPTGREGQGESYTSYQFKDRQVNDLINGLKDFTNNFVRPETPKGWQKVVDQLPLDAAPQTADKRGDGPVQPPNAGAVRPRGQSR